MSLVLGSFAIWLSFHFFSEGKVVETRTAVTLVSIKPHSEALQKLTGRWMGRFARHATERKPPNEGLLTLVNAMAVIALSLFLSSCTVSQETDSPVATPSTPDYVSYLKMIQEKVRSTWKFPAGVSGTHAVTLRFVLDTEGKLVSTEIVNYTDARLNKSAMEAMNRASPFPRIPKDLKRLAGEPMVIKIAAASAATAPALTPIGDPTQRLDLPGLSILPPKGENWFIAPLPPKSDNPAVPLVGFVKRLGEKPPTRAADARMVSARVTVYDLRDPRMQAPAAFETATAFLDWLKQGAEKATGGMVTGRQRLIEHDATLDNSFGPTCARYRRVTELSGWGQFRESLFILTTRGWFCLHPHWPQYMIDAGYTQVHLKGEEPVLVDVEIEPFLRSPLFTSTRPMAQAPMSDRRKESGDNRDERVADAGRYVREQRNVQGVMWKRYRGMRPTGLAG